MKIERNSVIAGQGIKTVRDLLRDLSRSDQFVLKTVTTFLHKRIWSDHVDDLVKRGIIEPDMRRYYTTNEKSINSRKGSRSLRIPDQTAAARALVDQLLNDGMVQRCKDHRDRSAYTTTMKGNALAMTGLVQRINRAKAEKLLQDVLARVTEINARADLLHWVAEVRVFGSYLTDTDDLGDLDLAIKLERRSVTGTGSQPWADACLEMARRSGKTFSNFLQELQYPETLVWRLIKNRSRHVSLHRTDELDENPAMGGKTIYTFVPPRA